MNVHAKISRRELTRQLRALIAGIKRIPISKVLLRHDLRDDLDFTTQGVRALSVPINDHFGTYGVAITPDEAVDAKTVRDLRNIVWGKVPTNRREPSSVQ